MTTLPADDAQLMTLMKRALAKVLDERRDWFEAMVTEAVEDLAMSNAIREGEATESVDRAAVFDLLES